MFMVNSVGEEEGENIMNMQYEEEKKRSCIYIYINI
jgi:hypothetical protein